MLNTVILDKNENTINILSSYLSKIEGVKLIGNFEDFNSIPSDLNGIDLIIFDINQENCDEILNKTKNVKDKNTYFIATSYEINSELVTKVLKEEKIKEFIIKPVLFDILEVAIDKVKNIKNDTFRAKANTICLFSNKGGIGKTSGAVNLAYEIANNTKKKTCLLDLSFNSQDVATFLNVEPKYNIDYILQSFEKGNEELILSLMNKYKDTDLYVLSFNDDINLSSKINPKLVTKIINSLKYFFSWIIIDTSSIVDETSVSIFNNSDVILLFSMMNLASIRNCQKCYELFDNIGYKDDKIKLIINRFIENSEISLKDIKDTLNKNIFYKIPNNYLTLIDAINLGCAVGEINPQSNIAKAYSNLALEVINIDYISLNENEKVNYNYGIFHLLKKMGE